MQVVLTILAVFGKPLDLSLSVLPPLPRGSDTSLPHRGVVKINEFMLAKSFGDCKC